MPATNLATAASTNHPIFTELTRDECEQVLARNTVGRLAFTFHDRVDIEPIHYRFADGWLYGRTSPGTKLAMLAHHPWVAFEVDEVTGLFHWESVVVKGPFSLIMPDTPYRQQQAYTRGVDLLRSMLPETLRADDPVPFRYQLFRIHLDVVRGRRARS